MSIIKLPHWTRQPQFRAEVNRSNSLTDQIAALVLPNEGVDVVTGNFFNGTRGVVPSLGGIGTDAAASGYFEAPAPDSSSSTAAVQYDVSGAITVLAVCLQHVATNAAWTFGRFNGSGSPHYAVGLFGGTFAGAVARLGNYEFTPSAADSTQVGRVHVVAITGDGSTANVYYDGRNVASSAYTPPTYVYDAANHRALIAGSTGLGAGSNTTCYLGAVWRRVLSSSEIAKISANPWQLFAPRRIWVPVSAGSAASYTLTAGAGSYSLTGQAALLKASRKVVAGAGSYSLTGNAAGIYRGLRLVAGAGTYSWSGQAANVRAQRKLVAAAGTYALTGNAAVLRLGRMLAMASGSYTFTGQAVGLNKTGSSSLAAETGSYALTGQAAGVLAARKLTAGAGSFALTGQAATLRLSRRFAADAGSFALTGQDAALRAARRLSAEAGVFNLTGSAAQLLRGYRLAATAGTYALTGNAAVLAKTGSHSLTAGAGSYAWTGTGATLTYSGEIFTDSEFWKYTVPAQPLLFTVPADPLGFTI